MAHRSTNGLERESRLGSSRIPRTDASVLVADLGVLAKRASWYRPEREGAVITVVSRDGHMVGDVLSRGEWQPMCEQLVERSAEPLVRQFRPWRFLDHLWLTS